MNSNFFNNSLILNVDDSDGARYAKSRILSRAGFTVIEAANGSDALMMARRDQPNLVLLDVKLPDINGFEVCRRLKSDKATQAIMVLQISASFIGIADKIRALDGGADNYLFEPIEPEELVANAKALLRLSRVERELRAVDRLKDEFLATLAHELRNPLGPISNAVELMRRLDPNEHEQQEKARQTIERHTTHLVRLVDDLLDVSRISQGKITLYRERVELKTFINSAREAAAGIIERRGHTLSVTLPSHDVWVQGDPVRLSQMVANLLNNAAKFTLPGGAIELNAAEADGKVMICIADNGIGIAKANLDFIFGLFAQDGYATDRVQDGLGIGLSLVRTLVELHQGTIIGHSDGLGQGSRFELTLPTYAALVVAAPTIAPAPPETVATRILIVDDNVDAADTLAMLLEMDGHQVRTTYRGEQGIECARQFQPQFVFLDIGLPDMTGYEVAASMRALPSMAGATLVALTGYGRDQDKALALEAGFDEHIVKPIAFARLAELQLHTLR